MISRNTFLVVPLALGLALGCRPPLTQLPQIPNARTPVDGVLSGGQPSPEQIERAGTAGVRTVINLRAAGEPGFEWEAELVERLGMKYVHLPIAGADGLTSDAVERFDRELQRGLEDGTVLLHCGSGNRIGAIFALREAWLYEADPQSALEFGLAAGLTRLEPVVRSKLGLQTPE